MKRFEAIYKDNAKNNHMTLNGDIVATEVVYDIIAESEQRALQLIDQQGEDSNDFELDDVGGVKDQMGRYFSESINKSKNID